MPVFSLHLEMGLGYVWVCLNNLFKNKIQAKLLPTDFPKFSLGMRWAVTFIKLVLSTLIDKFEISVHLTTNTKPSSQTGMLFFSANDVLLELKHLE